MAKGLFQKRAKEKAGHQADRDRKEDHHRNHMQRNRAAGDPACRDGVDRKKDDNADHVVKDRHKLQQTREPRCLQRGGAPSPFLTQKLLHDIQLLPF